MSDNIFGTANAILEKHLSISKEKVVPANDNDVFNANICSFCWGPYDEDHPGARLLKCNHVFGRDCLTQMIDAPNGNHCPVCRTSLFRPDLHVAVGRWLTDSLFHMLLCLVMAIHKLVAKIDKLFDDKPGPPPSQAEAADPLPWFIKDTWLLYLLSNNTFNCAKLVSENFTNLRDRNPALSRAFVVLLTWLPTWEIRRYYQAYKSSATLLPHPVLNALSIMISALFAGMAIGYVGDKITSHKDRLLFTGILLLSLMIQCAVRTIMAELCPFLL
jgi:hypothetical protein